MRDAAINLRAMPEQRDLIDHAASVLGKNRSDFMLEAACDKAQSVLLDQVFFSLDDAKFREFTAMLNGLHEILRLEMEDEAPEGEDGEPVNNPLLRFSGDDRITVTVGPVRQVYDFGSGVVSLTGPISGELSGTTSTTPAHCLSSLSWPKAGNISSRPAVTCACTGRLPRWPCVGTRSSPPPKTSSPLSDWLT